MQRAIILLDIKFSYEPIENTTAFEVPHVGLILIIGFNSLTISQSK